MVRGPEFHVALKSGQVLSAGRVGFGQECQCIIYPGELSGLTHLPLVRFTVLLDDGLPDAPGEGLISVGCGGQLAMYPGF